MLFLIYTFYEMICDKLFQPWRPKKWSVKKNMKTLNDILILL